MDSMLQRLGDSNVVKFYAKSTFLRSCRDTLWILQPRSDYTLNRQYKGNRCEYPFENRRKILNKRL